MRTNTINELISQLSCDNWEEILNASDTFVKMYDTGDYYVLDLLINLLENNTSRDTVNAIALALREISEQKSINATLKAIKNPKNKNNISTLVYALENLDCREYFLEIFSLFVLSKKGDVMLSAFNILSEQEFTISKKELDIAKNILNNSDLSLEDRNTAQEIIDYFTKAMNMPPIECQ